MNRVLPLLAALSFAPIFAGHTQPSAFDPEKLRLQVESLLRLRVQARDTARTAAIAEIQKQAKTGNGAVSYYENAYTDLTFAGKPGGGQAKVDWGKNNADLLKSPEFKAAAQLHLQYLALTLSRAGSKQPLDFVGSSMEYLKAYGHADAGLFARQAKAPEDQRRLLASPLKDSPIVKANRLQALLAELPDWEPAPGNPDGIFEKNVLGPLREARDPRLLDAWALRMEMGDKAVAAQKLDSRKNEFLNLQFPNWRFARAEDLLILGRREEAANEMYLLLQHYPSHPSFEKWGQRLLEILAPAPTGS
ncbi:MAG TPA: hypothetical protein VIS74_01365 [Chthoniobacterales bacterium]